MKALDSQAVCVLGFLCGSRCYSACLSTVMNQADDLQVYMLDLGKEIQLLINSEQLQLVLYHVLLL